MREIAFSRETIRAALDRAKEKSIHPGEGAFRPSVIPAEMALAYARSGAISPGEARKWLEGSPGMCVVGGPKMVALLIEELTRIAQRGA